MKKKKRNESKGRVIFTALVLLFLVAAAACSLKKESKEETVDTEQPAVEVIEPEKEQESSAEDVKEPVEEEKAPTAAPDKAEALATFLPDYDSFPLLETSPIRHLSMEVGAQDGEVRFNWMSPSNEPGTVTWYTIQNGDYTEYTAEECFASTSMPGYYVNKATVTGAHPGLSYAYKVGNDAGGWSPEYHYAVPEESDTLTFLATSDAQIGQAQYEEVQATIDRWDSVVTRLTSYVPEAQFLFHLGDQVADYGNMEHYDGFLNHLGLYKIPLAPVVGNHDVPNEDSIERLGFPTLPYFYEHFNVPNRSSTYGTSQFDQDGDYYFVRGDVLFIVLNSSTIQELDIHEQFVPKAVDAHPDTKWRVLVQHYPAYSGVEKYQKQLDEWMRKSLAYIAKDNDIDLVLSGHDHQYTRSYFTDRQCNILKDYKYKSGSTAVNPEGTLYVTCSTASGCIYQDVTKSSYLAVQGQPESPVALRVDITDHELKVTAYLVDTWEVYDEYTIRKE